MDIVKQIIKIIEQSPNDDLNIFYLSTGEKELFQINGVDIISKDNNIKKEINDFKSVIEDLDDCLFLEIVEDLESIIDIKTFDELLEQDSLTEEETEIVSHMISLSKTVINEHIQNRIVDYKDILERL